MSEIIRLKENETSPEGVVYGKIQAIPQSRVEATPAIDVDGIPNEPIAMTLLANETSEGDWKDVTVLSGLVVLYPKSNSGCKDGVDGLSAYEVWLNKGNEGTELDFLDSLKGEDGCDGLSAYEQWVARSGYKLIIDSYTDTLDGKVDAIKHIQHLKGWTLKESKTFVENLPNVLETSLDKQELLDIQSGCSQVGLNSSISTINTGTEQDFLDSLKGDNGDQGDPGQNGEDGLSAYEVWLNQGNEGTELDFLDSLKGEDGDPSDSINIGNSDLEIAPGIRRKISLQPGLDSESTTLLTIGDANNNIINFSNSQDFGFKFGINAPVSIQDNDLNVIFGNINAYNGGLGISEDLRVNGLGKIIKGNTEISIDGITTNGIVSNAGINKFNGAGIEAMGQGGKFSKIFFSDYDNIRIESIDDDPLNFLRITMSDDSQINLKKQDSIQTVQGLADALTTIGLLESSTIDTTGLKGDQGEPGQNGKEGLSAYDVWLNQGNEGTELDFLDSLKGEDGASFSDEHSASFISMKYDNTYPNLILVPFTPLKDSGGVKEFKPIVTLNSDEITLDFTGGLLNGYRVDVNSIAPILQVTSGPLDTVLRAVPDRMNNIIRIKIHGTPPDGDTPLNSLVSFNFLSMSNLFKK